MRHLRTAQRSVDQTECGAPIMSLWLSSSQHRELVLSNHLYTSCDAQFTSAADPSLWSQLCFTPRSAPRAKRQPLYTAEEKRRRDATPWTLVQGVLAPLQFLVFLISLGLVARYLATGEGLWVLTALDGGEARLAELGAPFAPLD